MANKKNNKGLSLENDVNYHQILNNLSLPVFLFGPEGEFQFLNVEAENFIHEYQLSEKNFYKNFDKKDQLHLKKQLLTLTSHSPMLSLEHGFEQPKKKLLQWKWDIRAIAYDNKQPILFQAVGHEMPEVKGLEQDLLRCRAAVDLSDQPIFMTDREGKIIYVNPTFENLYGYELSGVLGKFPNFLMKSGEKGSYVNFKGQISDQSADIVSVERINYTKDHQKINIIENIRPIFDKEDCIAYLFVQSDITGDKNLQQQLIKTEIRYRDIVEHSPNIIYSVNEKGIVQFANQRIFDVLAYSPEEVIGMPIKKLYSVDLRKKIEDDFRHYDQANPPAVFEGKMIRKDGGTVDISIDSITVSDEKGHAKEVLAIARDVTEAKKAKEDLQKAHDELEQRVLERTSELQLATEKLAKEKSVAESLLNSIGEAIIAIDMTGRITTLNPAAEDMFELNCGKVINKFFYKVVNFRNEKEKIINLDTFPLNQVVQQKKQVFTTTYFEKSNGKQMALATTVSPILFEGALFGIIGTFRDISKEKEIDRTKTEFVSLASHQLQTPLTAISWLLQILLKNNDLNKWQVDIVKDARDSTKRMIQLVDDFLNVSRLDMNAIGVVSEKADLVSFISQLIRQLTVLANENKQKIVFKCAKKRLTASFDQQLISQVVLNLLSNAIKYSPPNKTITIELIDKRTQVVISIKDQGIGISKEHQKRLFSKFYRTDQAVRYSTTGSGLGLYVIKKILNVCKGSISLSSSAGKGTTFTVFLPKNGPTVLLENAKSLSHHSID